MVVKSILIKFKPKGWINWLFIKYFTAEKLIAKKIFVPIRARWALILLPAKDNG